MKFMEETLLKLIKWVSKIQLNPNKPNVVQVTSVIQRKKNITAEIIELQRLGVKRIKNII